MYIDEIVKQLHPGFIVRTGFNTTKDYHYNIIHSIYGNTVILSNFKNSSDLVGQDIIIKVNTSFAEYLLSANILDISDSNPQTIKAKIQDCTKQNEHRHSERYLIKLGSNIKVGNDKIGLFSIIYNINSTGAFVETPLDIPVGTAIKLDLLPGGDEDVSIINALISRRNSINDSFSYGLVFANNSTPTMNKLNTILHNAEKFKFQLYDEWQKNTVTNNSPKSSGIKALIVDDIKFTRSYLKNIFENCGILNITEASNGSEAIEKIESYSPDIVTLDISMPVIDGIETVKHISGSFPLDNVIIISALIDNDTKNLLSKFGITRFITKPFTENQIINELKNIFPEVIQC